MIESEREVKEKGEAERLVVESQVKAAIRRRRNERECSYVIPILKAA
jgi:hypothetical protein